MQDVFVDLDRKISKIIEQMPSERRKLHEEISELLKKEVDANINDALNDSNGKIKNWQKNVVGSGGGYAAVHAVGGQSGASSPGAITNYLENGHKIRSSSGVNKYYKPRIKTSYVYGFGFYAKTRETIESKILNLAEKFADNIFKSLE